MISKNTDNLAVISISNRQSSNDLSENTELISEGKFYRSGDKFYIFYSESDTEETSACSVMITVEKDKVTMSRKGEFSSKMVYKEGLTDSVSYHTPFGDMLMMLKTEKVVNELTELGGNLRLCYKLIINGEEMDNDLELSVKVERN